MGIPLCTFDLDDGGRRLEEDPFVAELFRYLASAAPEERRQMLLDMQYILGELVPLEYASLEMIATAYHMRKMNDGNRPENDVYDRVVGNLLLCGRVPSANQETVNKLLIWMLKKAERCAAKADYGAVCGPLRQTGAGGCGRRAGALRLCLPSFAVQQKR